MGDAAARVRHLAHYPKALAAGVSFVPGRCFRQWPFGHCLRLNAGFALDEPVLARLAEVGRQLQAG